MRALAFLPAVLLVSGCFLDPTCQDHCDGDNIASCKWKCSGGGKLDIDECHREYGGTDCAAQTGPTGQPLACRMRPGSSQPDKPFCIDVHLPACDVTLPMLQCVGPNELANCVATTEGGYLVPTSGIACPLDAGTAGTCHPAPWGVTCVDVPKTPCDPAGFPRCLDAAHGQNCQGTVDAGLFVSTYDCGPTRTCSGDAGAGACR